MGLKEFYEMIGYEPYQEIRIKIDDRWQSFYPKNFVETSLVLKKYSKHNCYVGVNPRKTKGKKGDDVTHRRMMVFDIEGEKEKLPLSDAAYQERLEKGVEMVKKTVYELMAIEVSYIISSGRGIHMYYCLEPLPTKHQDTYVFIYNFLIRKINKALQEYEVKADPPVKDLPRIFGCPGTRNTKYEETTAMRQILYESDVINDIEKFVEDVEKKRTKRLPKLKTRKKITIKSLMVKPEFQVFRYKPKKGTGINNRLRFALKLLMREYQFSPQECEEVSNILLRRYGVLKKPMFLGNKYAYINWSPKIIQNYCLEHYDWCVDVGFKYPYLKTRFNRDYEESKEEKEFEIRTLDNWRSVKQYAIAFNQETMDDLGYKIIFYTSSLKIYLEKCCNEKLWKFIESSNLIEEIKYLVSDVREIDDVKEFMVEKNDRF
jgi:hypothetical protein